MTAAVPYTTDTFVKMVRDKVDELYDNIRDKNVKSRQAFIVAINECKTWFWNRDDQPGPFGTTLRIYYSNQKPMNTASALETIKNHILPILRKFANTTLPDEMKTKKRDGVLIEAASILDKLVLDMVDWFAIRPSPPVDKDGWDGIARPAPRTARARLAVLAAMRAQLSSINGVLLRSRVLE
jgi:hypothetical protein